MRGGTYWDPLATFGYIAARTTTIRLATHVLVLGYHHPLAIAKRYGTLDRVSGGRLILGVGVGSLRGGVRPARRRVRGTAATAPTTPSARCGSRSSHDRARVPAVRTTHTTASSSSPCATQPRVPIWVGGRTARSLRRAVELADGWAPFGLARADLAEMIARARESEPWAARSRAADAPPFELVLQNEHPFDPGAEPDRVRDAAARLADAGATTLNVRVVHHSLEHYLEQLAATRELIVRTRGLGRHGICPVRPGR